LTNATTGSDRIVPGQQPPAEERGSRLARFTRPAMTHWQFSIVVLAGIVVRIIVMVGYPPVVWFNDSYNYVYDAATRVPDEIRPNGYPFFLDLFAPLHRLSPVALVQAGMGIVLGVAIYALLRRRGLPWWGAALPTLPVFFDSYALHLEHMVTADPLFIFLVTIAVVILCWSDRPSVLAMAIAGLLIGYATLVRSVGTPLLVVALVAMLVRRVGWHRLGALLVAGIIPIGAYMLWFHGTYGKYALTESSGTFLYSRVSTFAECGKITLSTKALRAMCDRTPPALRPESGEYVWVDNELPPDQNKTTPLYNVTRSSDTALRFTPYINGLAGTFAKKAILGQPFDYLRVVTGDTLQTFTWNRESDPGDNTGNGPVFTFVSGQKLKSLIPWWAGDTGRAGHDHTAHVTYEARKKFGGAGLGNTRAVQPWARLLEIYQRYFFLRGPFLAVIVLIGVAGVFGRWRRWGGIGLLPWLFGAMLIVLPPMTAGFSYRYVLAAVPAACLAAGLAFARRPGDKSVGALAADLRRYLGRGVAVDQE
jgi:hypothetical protein